MPTKIVQPILRFLGIGILLGIGISAVDLAYFHWKKEDQISKVLGDFVESTEAMSEHFAGVASIKPQYFLINGKRVEVSGRCDPAVWLDDTERYVLRCNDFPGQTNISVQRRTEKLAEYKAMVELAVDGTFTEVQVGNFSIKSFELDKEKMRAKIAEGRGESTDELEAKEGFVDLSEMFDVPNTIYKHMCDRTTCISVTTTSRLAAEGIAAQIISEDA